MQPHSRPAHLLQVYAQRRPSLLRLLDHEDELFFLVSAWLHRGSLRASDASFAEGLYALRRVPAERDDAKGAARLSPQQRISTLALLVRGFWRGLGGLVPVSLRWELGAC